MKRYTAAAAFMVAAPAFAEPPALTPPIDCALGDGAQCYIQSYMDRDPSDGARDFTCQSLSYDGHKGTDFALRSHTEISRNIAVVASAAGVVVGARDGMQDKVFDISNAPDLRGRDCGNGVVIAHGDGWETQYCHLRQGSVQAVKGQHVEAGTILGMVGMSGRASFPHVHLSVRQNGRPVDPFAPSDNATCSTARAQDSLWRDTLDYQPTGIIAAGFSGAIPPYDNVKAGTAHTAAQSMDAEALVLWGFAYGSHPNDVMRLQITNLAGQKIYSKDVTLEKTQAQYFRAGGRKTNGADWYTQGTYTGTVMILRDGELQSEMTTEIEVTQ